MNETTKQLVRPVIESLVRRGVVAFVAWMVTWSEVKPDEAWVNSTTALIVGAIIWLVIESWSWVSKKKLLSTAPVGAVIVPKDAVASIAVSNADQSSSRIGPTNTLGAILLALMMIPAAMTMPGCAGQQAREKIGVPATMQAVDSIVADANVGLGLLEDADRDAAQADLDAFVEAIKSGDLVTIQADAFPRWPVVKNLVEAGIEHRLQEKTLGPGGAAIRVARVREYGEVLESFVYGPLAQ